MFWPTPYIDTFCSYLFALQMFWLCAFDLCKAKVITYFEQQCRLVMYFNDCNVCGEVCSQYGCL